MHHWGKLSNLDSENLNKDERLYLKFSGENPELALNLSSEYTTKWIPATNGRIAFISNLIKDDIESELVFGRLE